MIPKYPKYVGPIPYIHHGFWQLFMGEGMIWCAILPLCPLTSPLIPHTQRRYNIVIYAYIYICTICVCILYVVQNEEAFTATKPWFHVENVPQTSPLIETPDVRLAGWDAEPKPETSVKMLGADCSWDFECVRFFREGFRKLNENHPEKGWTFSECYPLVNSLVDPENHPFLMETSLPTPICQGLC